MDVPFYWATLAGLVALLTFASTIGFVLRMAPPTLLCGPAVLHTQVHALHVLDTDGL